MNILFVCKYNRFRSRVAEALFNHYNNDKSIQCQSAGLLDVEQGLPMIVIASKVLDGLKVRYNHKQTSRQITKELINWADRIYLVADDADPGFLPKSKTRIVNIPDSYTTEQICKQTVMQIDFFVRGLMRSDINL